VLSRPVNVIGDSRLRLRAQFKESQGRVMSIMTKLRTVRPYYETPLLL